MKTKCNFMKKLMLFTAAFAFCAVLCGKPVDANAAAVPTGFAQTDADQDYLKYTWQSDPTADEYGTRYSLNKTSWSAESTSYSCDETIYNLSAGTTYYVQVRGYTDGVPSAWSQPFAVVTAPNDITTLSQTSATNTSVTYTWNAVTGVTGYMLLKALPNDTAWTKIGSVAASTTSYTLAVPTNSTYDVAVVPYRNVANNPFIAYATTYYPTDISCVTSPTTPKSLNIASRNYNTKNTEFVWEPTSTISNTDGYELEVYYYKKNGKTKKLGKKDIQSKYTNYYDFKSSKLFSSACKYRVRAYKVISGKKYYSNWSKYKEYIPGAVAKSVKHSYRATTGTLKWNKVTGAQSYTIYWKDAADDKWKVVKKNVKGTSATVKYLSSSTYNYYYIRANKVKIGSKRKNSSSSSKVLDGYRTY